jgi:hypothetical protein
MTKYNHLFTVAYMVETEHSCATEDDYPEFDTLLHALENRVREIRQNRQEEDLLSTPPEDTFEVNDDGTTDEVEWVSGWIATISYHNGHVAEIRMTGQSISQAMDSINEYVADSMFKNLYVRPTTWMEG